MSNDKPETSVPMELDEDEETNKTTAASTNTNNASKPKSEDNDIEMGDKAKSNETNKSSSNKIEIDEPPNSNTTDNNSKKSASNSQGSKKASKKEQLKKLREQVAKMRKIVTEGCGNWRCKNPHCFSNSLNANKTYTDREASLLATKMIKEKFNADDPCRQFGYVEVDALSYQNIKYLEMDNSNFDENSDEYKKCMKIINETMEHWDILDESFVVKIDGNDKTVTDIGDNSGQNVMKPSNHDPRIRFAELDAVFRIIMARDSVREEACETLLKTLENKVAKENQKTSLTLYELRALLILLECPLILSEDPLLYDSLSKLLILFDILNPNCQKVLKKWISNYNDILRIKRFVDCLQQYLSIKIVECEIEIEDETQTWKDELHFDENGDADEQEEILSQIREKQQEYRQKKISEEIACAVRMIGVIWDANQMIINDSANLDKELEKKQAQEESQDLTDAKSSDNSSSNLKSDAAITSQSSLTNLKQSEAKPLESLQSHRVSLTGVSSIKHPLPLSMFHNSGLNETICAHEAQRRVIHRHDFYHWKEKDFFSYLQYPYLLDAGSKAKYLEFENLILQSHARRQRMLELMMNSGGGIGALLMGGRLNRDHMLEMDLTIRVRRTHLIEDTLPQIDMIQSPSELRRRLRIIFDGEKGIDQGGLTKEYFQLIIEELFDVKFGMFVFNEETQNYWFNSNSFESREFKLVGMLMGIAVYNNIILDLHFPKALYKKMLDGKCDFNDFRDFDPSMAHGFEQLLNYTQDPNDPSSMSIEDMFGERTFSVEYDFYGSKKIVDLKPNGRNIILSDSNKQEYVDLYINYILNESISEQFNSFYSGWKMVCGHSKLFDKDRFNGDELELLICGSKEFDFEALKKSVKYEDGFDAKSSTITQFWDIAMNFSNEQKRKLISFITGSDRVPIRGLSDLVLTISKNGNDDKQLPTSHTCFNHLLLPEYSTKEILQQRLLTAINNAKGFGLL